jgi:hypothetical protein
LKKTGTFFLTRDNLSLGLILGLISPLIVFIIVYYMRFADSYELNEYLHLFLKEKQLISFWGVWCLVGNIALFTYYINTHKDKTAKGIFAVTLLYGIGVLVLKLLI